jgi:pimeloyl-ACP methyl ester carboxylesterase
MRAALWCVVALFVAVPCRGAPPEKKVDSQEKPSAEKSFDSHGVQIRYIEAGKGEPVVLIHGFAVPSSEMMWIKNALSEPKVLPELAKNHHVIALDCRGHGKSGKPHDPKQYGSEMSQDVVRLLDHLKIKKAHVVGYSMGAMIAGNLLVAHPERLLSVTLGGGAPLLQLDPEFIGRRDQLAASLEEGKGMASLLAVFTPPGKPQPPREQLEALSKQILTGQDQKALAAAVRGIKDLQVTEAQLKANKVPVLMIYGSQDGPQAQRDRSKHVAEMLHGKYEEIEGGDHMTTPGKPEFRKAIREFIESHSGRG